MGALRRRAIHGLEHTRGEALEGRQSMGDRDTHRTDGTVMARPRRRPVEVAD
jgi:hypothetical protein